MHYLMEDRCISAERCICMACMILRVMNKLVHLQLCHIRAVGFLARVSKLLLL